MFVIKEKDSYKTIAENAKGLFKDKGSKFIAFAYPVQSEEKVKEIVLKLKKEYYDARHHCYAFRIGNKDELFRFSDDGEPSGTAGKPIYGQILSNNLSDTLIVVIRYFGGILLGTGGLINAYKSAASDVIHNAKIVEKILKRSLVLSFEYEQLSIAMRIVKEENLEIHNQDFKETCELTINIRLADYERIRERFENIYGIELKNN